MASATSVTSAVDSIISWLESRIGVVVVDGEQSSEHELLDMVVQGTVFGPPLWNVMFADARRAIQKILFTECVFAVQ